MNVAGKYLALDARLIQKSVCGIYRNLLARLRRMRERCAGRGFPRPSKVFVVTKEELSAL
jgi:hypothetical protein